MLRLSDKSPGPSWAVWDTPVSFNIYSSTNPDMITVYYYPKDVTDDPLSEDNFTTFKRQLVNFNVLKNGVKSINYIDDEDDVIHIDSEQEFMEAIKFAKAYKEKNGQSVFLLIDEKSQQEVESENGKISTDDDKAELMEEENKVDLVTQAIVSEMINDVKSKNKSLKKKSKSNKADEKTEPNTCCKNYLEQFKQEIITEVTKNVLKKLSNALNSSEIDSEIKNEDNRGKVDHNNSQLSFSHEIPLKIVDISPKESIFSSQRPPFASTDLEKQYFTQNNTIDDKYSILKGGHYYQSPYWFSKPTDYSYMSESIIRKNPSGTVPFMYKPYPTHVEDDYLKQNETSYGDELLTRAMKEDLMNRDQRRASTTAEIHSKCIIPLPPFEKKTGSNDQKKKPKITNLVVLKRDDLTQEQKSLIDQFKKMKPKRPNALEMKSTIKKIAAPSPKKSSSSKIKNKAKIEKELILNAKKISNLKLDSDEVQKTGGCKRKSHSTDENRAVKSCSFDDSLKSLSLMDSMSFEAYEKLLRKKLDQEKQFTSNFLKNIRIFPNPSMIPMKDEEKKTKEDAKETWSQETNESDGEDNEKDEKVEEKVLDQDEQSTSDEASTLSETSSLSEVSENNFEFVYYDRETNDVGVKINKRESSSLDTKENPVTKNTPVDSAKQDATSVKNESSTEQGSKQSEEPKKEVLFDVIIEDIGPDNECEVLIPELSKRPGGDYSYVRDTLPKVEVPAPETTEKNTKKETDSKQQDKEIQQNSPSHSAAAAPNVSSYSSASHSSAPKLPKTEEKLKKTEKKIKEADRYVKEAEKKFKASYNKSRSKTSRDDRAPSSSDNLASPPTNLPTYSTYSTSGSCSYSNSAKNSPEHGLPYVYGPYVNLAPPLSHRHNIPNHGSGPMPPMYPPPPPYPSTFSSASSATRGNPLGPNGSHFHSANLDHEYFQASRFDAYAPMTATLENMLPFQSASVGSFDRMKSFHENIATKAAAHAYAHARQAVDNYFSKQNERR